MGESGAPGRNFACNLRVRSTVLYILSYESKKWCAGLNSNQLPRVYETRALPLSYRSKKWCAGADSHRHLLLISEMIYLLIYRRTWLPRTDSHSVVLIQSQAGYYYLTGQKLEPTAGIAPASSALQKRRDYLSIHVGKKWRKSEGMLPIPIKERSVFKTAPARLSGSTSNKKVGRHGAAPCSAS